MNVDSIELGYLRENCYLLEKDGEYLLVDPGEDISKILDFIRGKNIIGILVTHHHFDNLKEGIKIIGNFNMEVIFTPGHTKDSVCYYFRNEKIMITGDFLFAGTVGRWDLDDGNEGEMYNSIEKIKKYDDDIIIFPGHGDSSVLGNEKKYNPYFR